jgi:phospholipid-binding lipoprotein MlaA
LICACTSKTSDPVQSSVVIPPAPAGSATVSSGPLGADVPHQAENEDATVPAGPTAPDNDPWEPYNRAVDRFNRTADKWVVRPVASAYDTVTPEPVQTGVSNFFSNMGSPVTLVNQLLQGKPAPALQTLGRFAMNTTVGIGGLLDPASAVGIPRHAEDFGQTMGVWGWSDSRYFILPLMGPGTLRDTLGQVGDMPLSPIGYIDNSQVTMGLKALRAANTRAGSLGKDNRHGHTIDEYVITRDTWMRRRNGQIHRDLHDRSVQ